MRSKPILSLGFLNFQIGTIIPNVQGPQPSPWHTAGFQQSSFRPPPDPASTSVTEQSDLVSRWWRQAGQGQAFYDRSLGQPGSWLCFVHDSANLCTSPLRTWAHAGH